jgi:PAS domain S-box-containing protein
MGKFLRFAVIFLAYFAAGYLALELNAFEGFASLVWFPTGIAIAAVYSYGHRVGLAIFLGAFLFNKLHGATFPAALAVAAGNCLEAIVANFLLRRMRFNFSRILLKDAMSYLVGACTLATFVSAGIGTLSLYLAGNLGSPWQTMSVWWLGDFTGALVGGLFLLVWSNHKFSFRKISAYRWLEISGLAALVVVTLYWMFGTEPSFQPAVPKSYFLFPLIIWCAARFGLLGSTALAIVVMIVGTWGTLNGIGVFWRADPLTNMVFFQIFLAISALVGLLVASIFGEKTHAYFLLEKIKDSLDAKVRERTMQLVEAQEIAHIGNWTWNPHRDEITWSDEIYRIYGLEPQSVKLNFATYLSYLHPEDRDVAAKGLNEILKGGGSFVSNRRIIRADGVIRTIQARGRIVYDENRKPLYLKGTSQDITEAIQAETELRALSTDLEKRVQERTQSLEIANQAKDEFLAVLSHELRTPLNVILGWTETLSEPGVNEDTIQRGLKALRRSAMVQKSLIADLLDTSRIIAGKLSIDKRDFDLVQLLREVIPAFTAEAKTRNINLSFESEMTSAWVNGDDQRVQQIVTNLVSNAIKFTPENGQIKIKLNKSGDRVEISIQDTGIGIDPEFLPKVFDRFRQESIGTNRKHGGLGLGLAITQFLVRQHNGLIRAESDGKGKGTTLTFTLPLKVEQTAPLIQSNVGPKISLRGLTVLLVDDAPDILYLLSLWLKNHGAKAYTADSVANAMKILETVKPDVIFCDIGMPEQDGFAFIKQLRNHANVELRNIPAAALTAYAEDSQRIKTLANGFTRHLTKPIHSEKFLATVQEMLGSVPAEVTPSP